MIFSIGRIQNRKRKSDCTSFTEIPDPAFGCLEIGCMNDKFLCFRVVACCRADALCVATMCNFCDSQTSDDLK